MFLPLQLFLGPKVPSASLAERAQAAPTARKVMAEVQADSGLNRAIETSITKDADPYVFTNRQDKVWHDRIVNYRIGRLIGPFKV